MYFLNIYYYKFLTIYNNIESNLIYIFVYQNIFYRRVRRHFLANLFGLLKSEKSADALPLSNEKKQNKQLTKQNF